jgi:hypothetical protein
MSIQVKLSKSRSIKVKTQIAVPESLSGVDNVDVSTVQDGYILMYDDVLQRYTFADPDTLLSKVVQDNTLPQDFIDKLDADKKGKMPADLF